MTNDPAKELIDGLFNAEKPSFIKEILRDPEDEHAIFVRLENGLVFSLTVKLVQ